MEPACSMLHASCGSLHDWGVCEGTVLGAFLGILVGLSGGSWCDFAWGGWVANAQRKIPCQLGHSGARRRFC